MTIQIEFWQLLSAMVGLLLSFLGFAMAAGRQLLGQMDKRLDARFAAIERTSTDLQALEREFLRFQATLPVEYVRREDWVRNQTVIEAKLDGLATRIDHMIGGKP